MIRRKYNFEHVGFEYPYAQLHIYIKGNTQMGRSTTASTLRFRPAVSFTRLRVSALSFPQVKHWRAY
jgi:hypothetical protein